MKKLLMILVLILSTITVCAQNVNWYRATSLAIKEYNYQYNYWNPWTDWEKVNVNIKIDLDSDVIIIYSKVTQVYTVLEASDVYIDADGGKQIKCKVLDADGDKATVRLRMEASGNSQLYVDYADVNWVYNVKRIK